MRDRTINHIVFYGTLMAKAGGRGITHEPNCTLLGDISFPGLLFSVGGFPALVMGDGVYDTTSHNHEPNFVVGELYQINDQSIMSRFDGIEGYSGNKDGDLYTRTVIGVNHPTTDERIYAWVYTWNRSPEGLQLIESGSWMQHTNNRG